LTGHQNHKHLRGTLEIPPPDCGPPDGMADRGAAVSSTVTNLPQLGVLIVGVDYGDARQMALVDVTGGWSGISSLQAGWPIR
jgi:hypothetical protein